MSKGVENPWSADDLTENTTFSASLKPTNTPSTSEKNRGANDCQDDNSALKLEKNNICEKSGIHENVWSNVSKSLLKKSAEIANSDLSHEVKVENKESELFVNINDDFSSVDDDFGVFETLPITSINYSTPPAELMASIFPNFTKVFDPPIENYSRNIILNRENTLVMKYYNNLIANTRIYGADKNLIFNFRKRGCLEKTELHKDILEVSKEWTIVEKGVDMVSTSSTDLHYNSNMTGNTAVNGSSRAGKQNIFRWSTKVDDVTKEDTSSSGLKNKKQVGQKLLNASFEKAREIIEDRMEIQKKERIKLEKGKQERDERLRKEQEKKEEEIKKYSLKNGPYSGQKKKGLLKRFFGSKSKIAKDHISHDKVTNGNEDNIIDEKNISLKEQFRRRSSFISLEHNLNENDNDCGDDENDNESDSSIQGYNKLDGSGIVGDGYNNLGINIYDNHIEGFIDQEHTSDCNSILEEQFKEKGLNTRESDEHGLGGTVFEEKNVDENFGSFVLPKVEKTNILEESSSNIMDIKAGPSTELVNPINESSSCVTKLNNEELSTISSKSSSDEFDDFIVSQVQTPELGKKDSDEFDDFVKSPVEKTNDVSVIENSNTRVNGSTENLQQSINGNFDDYIKPKALFGSNVDNRSTISCEISEELVPNLNENFATFYRKSVLNNSDLLSTNSLARPKRKLSTGKNSKVNEEANLIDL